MADDVTSLVIKVDSTDVKKADKDLDSLSKTSSNVESSVNSLSGAFKAAIPAIGFGAIASDILQVNRQMEMLRTSLTSVTGSAERGKDAFKFIQDFAINTPFEVDALTKAFISLKNFGIQPTTDVMRAITNQASKLGASEETLSGITLALGQAWAKGKLQGEEILQLVERGVPVWDLLSKATGRTTAELQSMSSKGQLTRDVISKLIAEMDKMAEGSSVRAMNTLNGSISNLSDSWKMFEDTLMQDKAEGIIKSIVLNLTSSLNGLSALIDSNLSGQITRLETKIQYFQFSNSLMKGAMSLGGFDVNQATGDLERLKRAQQVEELKVLERQQQDQQTADLKRAADKQADINAKITADKEKSVKKQIKLNEQLADSWKNFESEMNMMVFDNTQSLVSDVEEYRKKQAEEHLKKQAKETERTSKKLADDISDYYANTEDKMSKFAERAAQNMQDSFANFLFDPFAKGTDNMGLQFANMLRRMAAEEVASSILDWVKPYAKGFGSSMLSGITGMFATGGDHSGGLRIVGENGPELEATGASRIFNAQQTKDILNGSNGGVNNIVVNVANDKNMSADQLGAKIAEQIATKVSQREIANATRAGNRLNPTTRFT